LCTDAGYTGAPALRLIQEHGYIPHVQGRRQEAVALKHHPGKKARRWVVEVAHSWFNRFRKLLVRYEKLERSFLALNPGRRHHCLQESALGRQHYLWISSNQSRLT
jgi:IS5 family transposase